MSKSKIQHEKSLADVTYAAHLKKELDALFHAYFGPNADVGIRAGGTNVGFLYLDFFGERANIHLPNITATASLEVIWADVMDRLDSDLKTCCDESTLPYSGYGFPQTVLDQNLFLHQGSNGISKLFILVDGKISKFYDIDIEYNNSKSYAIFTCVNKATKTEFKFYAQKVKDSRLWTPISKTHSIFQRMEVSSNAKLSYSFGSWDTPKLDYATGEVKLPQNRAGFGNPSHIFWCEVKDHTPEFLSVDFIKVIQTNNSQINNGISVVCQNHTFTITKNGKLQVRKTDLEHPDWIGHIKSFSDFIPNPTNRSAHPFLGDKNNAKYEGEQIFVTSRDEVYIKVTESVWVPLLNVKWLERHLDDVPEGVRKEWGYSKLLQTLIQ